MIRSFLKRKLTDNQLANIFVNGLLEVIDNGFKDVASLINEDTTTNLFPAVFISATGGTVTTDGNFKIHTFTGDGTFIANNTVYSVN